MEIAMGARTHARQTQPNPPQPSQGPAKSSQALHTPARSSQALPKTAIATQIWPNPAEPSPVAPNALYNIINKMRKFQLLKAAKPT